MLPKQSHPVSSVPDGTAIQLSSNSTTAKLQSAKLSHTRCTAAAEVVSRSASTLASSFQANQLQAGDPDLQDPFHNSTNVSLASSPARQCHYAPQHVLYSRFHVLELHMTVALSEWRYWPCGINCPPMFLLQTVCVFFVGGSRHICSLSHSQTSISNIAGASVYLSLWFCGALECVFNFNLS